MIRSKSNTENGDVMVAEFKQVKLVSRLVSTQTIVEVEMTLNKYLADGWQIFAQEVTRSADTGIEMIWTLLK